MHPINHKKLQHLINSKPADEAHANEENINIIKSEKAASREETFVNSRQFINKNHENFQTGSNKVHFILRKFVSV